MLVHFLVTLLQVRRALKKAEKELEYQSWKAPSVLKQWLQMTFDKETKHFHHKRAVALKQMKEAKEAVCFDPVTSYTDQSPSEIDLQYLKIMVWNIIQNFKCQKSDYQ